MSTSLFARLHRRFNPSDAVTRRRALQAALTASAGFLLSDRGVSAQDKPQKRVVVIGAGLSGLACAYELKAAGYKVTVFESRPRLGGRVLSFKDFVKGKNVEGGGELIGGNHPTWVKYAEKFGLEMLDVLEDEEAEMPVYLMGKLLDQDAVKKVYEEMDVAFKTLSDAAEKIDPETPWTSPDAAKLDAQTMADWLKTHEVEDLTRLAIGVQIASDNAVDNERASLLGMLAAVAGGGGEKYWTETEIYRCKGGNQQLALKLAEAIGPDFIRLRLPVTEVKIGENGVVVTAADGRTIEADDVVLAVPPSVWHRIKFSPELPEKLRPQMGVAVKYEVAFKKRFWVEKNLLQYSLSDQEVSQTWELTDNQQDAKEVDTPGALIGFSGGSAAEKCRSRKGEARDAHYAKEFENLYPGFAENKTAVRFMDWPGDEWTLAGYSFPAPGQVTTVGPLLYKGVAGRLHFAGEHACYRFVGYMEGALYAGANVARRLAERDGVKG